MSKMRRPGYLSENPFFTEQRKRKSNAEVNKRKFFTDDEKRAILADIEMKMRNDWRREEAIESTGISENQYYSWRKEL